MNSTFPFWVMMLYALACFTAYYHRFRWVCASSLFILNYWIMTSLCGAVVFIFMMAGLLDNSDFAAVTLLYYLLFLTIFILLNNVAAKTTLLVLAHLLLLADVLFRIRDDLLIHMFGQHWPVVFVALAAPIWMLGFRFAPKAKAA